MRLICLTMMTMMVIVDTVSSVAQSSNVELSSRRGLQGDYNFEQRPDEGHETAGKGIPCSSPKTNEAMGRSETNFVAKCNLPSIFGDFKMHAFTHSSTSQMLEPVVVCHGNIRGKENVLVRVHDQCFTSEVLGSKRCDCREQLHESLDRIQKEGGVLIYLQQEGRGIGLPNKVAAYALQDLGLDTVDANLQLGLKDEAREYDSVPQILEHLEVKSIRLMTNNPYKVASLSKLGVVITERVGITIAAGEHNARYLNSKRDRMHHILDANADLAFSPSEASKKAQNVALKPRSNSRLLGRLFRRRVMGSDTGDSGSSDGVEERVAVALGAKGGASSTATAGPGHIKTSQSDNDLPRGEEGLAERRRDEEGEAKAEGEAEREGEAETLKPYIFGEASVRAAIAAVGDGKVVCVVDDEDRENEGDLIMAADKATAESIGFMVRYTSGVICVSLTQERLEELKLPPMVACNEDPKGTAYTVSVDAKHGTSTGISALDRAITLRNLVDPRYTADDFTRPGHTFPLRYKKGGVLRRMGHTEASLDLSALAGLRPGGVLAEIVNDDGSMMRLDSPSGGLRAFTRTHGLVLTSVQDIIAFRQRHSGANDPNGLPLQQR